MLNPTQQFSLIFNKSPTARNQLLHGLATMVWPQKKHLLALSLTFFRYAQSAPSSSCSARLVACWALDLGNAVYDYELLYDTIPSGSINSICGNLAKPFTQASLGWPGCTTYEDLVAFSTRRSGTDTSNGFNKVQSTFRTTLNCQNIQSLGSCQVIPASSSVSSRTVSKWTPLEGELGPSYMTTIGQFIFVGARTVSLNLLTITAGYLGSGGTLLNHRSVGRALEALAEAASTRSNWSQNLMTYFTVISKDDDHYLDLAVTIDVGLGNVKDFVGDLEPSEWLTLLMGVTKVAVERGVDSLAATYDVRDRSNQRIITTGLMITIAVIPVGVGVAW